MNIQKGFFLLVACLAILGVSSCSEEAQIENCIEGTWQNDVICGISTKYIFSSNGTGVVYQDNCENTCVNGVEWRVKSNFDYELSSSTLTITFTQVHSCDSVVEGGLDTYSIQNVSCEDDVLTLSGAQAGMFARQ